MKFKARFVFLPEVSQTTHSNLIAGSGYQGGGGETTQELHGGGHAAPARKHLQGKSLALPTQPRDGGLQERGVPLQATMSLLSGSHCSTPSPHPKHAPPSSLWVPPSLELQVSRRIVFPPQLLRGYRETGNTFQISFSRKRAQTSEIREMEWRIKAVWTTYWRQHSLWGAPKSSPFPH